MDKARRTIEVTLRIPANWEHPAELFERLPSAYQLAEDTLILPSGESMELTLMPPDEQFSAIFASSCRRPPTEDEIAIVESYSVNVGIVGKAGSLKSARSLMNAASAFIKAGAGGVFIDNSGLSHGGGAWLDMTKEASPDALSFAFVSVIAGKSDVWTVGMHVLGFPDIVMRAKDLNEDGDQIIETIRYVCGSDKPIGNGHVLADESGPRFRAEMSAFDKVPVGTPMHNPFGYLRLVSMKDVASRN